MSQKPMFNLKGKVALVTGAATGIGQGIAEALAHHGADVAISNMSGLSLDETAEKVRAHGSRVLAMELDVRKMDHIERGVQNILKEFGKIDILVNNAGINRPLPGLEVTEENWDDHYNTNVKGGFFLSQKVAPHMIKQNWGRIIFISSQSGFIGIPGQPVYCSAKGAVVQLVRTLGVEWAKNGITVNSVAPTFVETNLTRKRLQTPEFSKFVLGKIPRGKLGEIKEVAACVVFLASEEASLVNCDNIHADGGWTAW